MSNEIRIETDTPLTLEAYVSLASDIMVLVGEAAEGIDEIDETFSIADLSDLLNKMSVRISDEFEIRPTPSRDCHVVYEPYVPDESEFDAERRGPSDFSDEDDAPPICLWINRKVFRAFVDRKLYGVAFALYFYLGYLMTRSAKFAVSHNISFEEIVKNCTAVSHGHFVKHRTTLMRALSDLQDAGLIKWHAENATFELLHITPYDPFQTV